MKDNYNVVVLMPTYNCIEAIDGTLQSIFTQNFDKKRIKIVAVDNGSTDGTCEKLIDYSIKYGIAVYQMQKKSLPTRLMQKALFVLNYTDYKYITVVCPGDRLYQDFIEKGTAALDKYADSYKKVLIVECDISDEYGNIFCQEPIFSDDCILMRREHYPLFFSNGIGHKVQCLFAKGVIPTSLPELPFCVDYTDWFKKAIYSFSWECIYLKNSFACIQTAKYSDLVGDLILRLYLQKRLELIRGTVFADIAYQNLDTHNFQDVIDTSLSNLALRYAVTALNNSDLAAAKKILLFAEMVNENIINSECYALIDLSICNGKVSEEINSYCYGEEKTVPPPEGAIVLSSRE